jgi:hypothetical protein
MRAINDGRLRRARVFAGERKRGPSRVGPASEENRRASRDAAIRRARQKANRIAGAFQRGKGAIGATGTSVVAIRRDVELCPWRKASGEVQQ